MLECQLCGKEMDFLEASKYLLCEACREFIWEGVNE